ncbi:peptidase domain-containing ABC transporter [Sinimarinibacterium flocculans]|uniref:peptidase domain-containing ABC transporter n=1 Tax=Sinimarinibacterium flocculans TaxID=985250 RepID=UPI003514996E
MSDGLIDRLNQSLRSKLPSLLQSEIAECGLACLAMISAYHGRKVDLNKMRRTFPVSNRGMTLKSLMDIADRLDLITRAVRLELADIGSLRLPAILHWDRNHFVVLKSVSRKRLQIHDPAVGRRTLSLESASSHFTGVALELTPASRFTPKDERDSLKLTSFWKNALGLDAYLIQMSVVALFIQLLALTVPFYVQVVIDQVVVRGDVVFLTLLALAFMLVTLMQAFLEWYRGWAGMYIGNLLTLQMHSNLVRHMLKLPLDFFLSRHVGDIVSRFGSMAAVQALMTDGVIRGLINVILFTLTGVMVLVYEYRLALIAVGLLLIYAIARMLRYRALRVLSTESLVIGAESSSQFMETIRSMVTIKTFGLEGERLNLWQNRQIEVTNASIRIGRMNLGFGALNKVLLGSGNIAIVYCGAVMIMNGTFTIGMLVAFLAYQAQFVSAGIAIVDQWSSFRLLGMHLERISDVALASTEESETRAPGITSSWRSVLRLEHVTFRYALTEPLLFTDLNLSIEPGECVVIVGESGSGKSTLLRLLMGLQAPQAGAITLDGLDIRRIGLANYRAMIAAVTQEDRLLSGSIAENITLFSSKPDSERMIDCAKSCCIHDAIMKMPMTYHTLIGDMGDVLSAGERQRLMLARALYRQPKILFLDEATSNLDKDLDVKINGMLAEKEATRIIVTHRQTSLAFADRVFRLENGSLEQLTVLRSTRASGMQS